MKKLFAVVALVAMIAVNSVAQAATSASVVNATVSNTSSFSIGTCASLTSLALTPAFGVDPAGNAGSGYFYDTKNCNLTVASNAAGWTLAFAETTGGASLIAATEVNMGHTYLTVGHPNVITDCAPTGACNLSDTVMPTHSEWGLWWDGVLAANVIDCKTSSGDACELATSRNLVTAGAVTSGGAAENLTMNVAAVVDYTVTAKNTYTDGLTYTFTGA